MVTYYKDKIGEEDLSIGFSTFLRDLAAGAGTQELNQINRETFSVDWYKDTREYASFSAAISDISTDDAVLIVAQNEAITGNVTVPANVTLWVLPTGLLTISAGVVLTLNCAVIAEKRQIFSIADVNNVAGSIKNDLVYPEWFGCAVDGLDATPTDDYTELQAALNLAAGANVNLFLSGYHYIATGLSTSESGFGIIGVHRGNCGIITDAAIDILTLSGNTARLKNFLIDGGLYQNSETPIATAGVVFDTSSWVEIDDVSILYINGEALDLDGLQYSKISVYIEECGDANNTKPCIKLHQTSQEAKHNTFKHCHFVNNYWYDISVVGDQTTLCQYNSIVDCKFKGRSPSESSHDDLSKSIYLEGCINQTIIGNTFEFSKQHAIYGNIGGTQEPTVAILGNVFKNTWHHTAGTAAWNIYLQSGNYSINGNIFEAADDAESQDTYRDEGGDIYIDTDAETIVGDGNLHNGSCKYPVFDEGNKISFNPNKIDSRTKRDLSGGATIGAGEDTLFTYTSPAGEIRRNQIIRVKAVGENQSSNGNKTVKFYLGTASFTIHAADNNTSSWVVDIEIDIKNLASQNVSWVSKIGTSIELGASDSETEDLTSDTEIKITGECANASDQILLHRVSLEFI